MVGFGWSHGGGMVEGRREYHREGLELMV